MKRIGAILALVMLTLSGGSAQQPQSPQPQGPPPRPEKPVAQDSFVPQSQAQKEPEIPSAPLLYGAYAFVWAALLVYVFLLWRRIGRVEREVHEVSRKLRT